MNIITVVRWLIVIASIVLMFLVIVAVNSFQMARKESVARRHIEEGGGFVSFKSSAPAWVRNVLSEDGLGALETVAFGPRTQDNDLSVFGEQLRDVKEVMLNGTKIRGPGLIYLRKLPRLERVNLTKSDITDEGLKHLGDLGRLKKVSLAFTRITDRGVAELARLRNLRELVLEGTEVTDACLPYLTELPLEELNVNRTAVTPHGLDLLRKKNKKVSIYARPLDGPSKL